MEKKRILVIDDEKDFADMVKLNLESTGNYEVRTENKGRNALAAAREFKPNLIFLDIIMADMDGGAVRFNLKGDADTTDIPVVFLTAIVTDSEVDDRGNMIGGYPFLAKPVSVDKLIECINKNLG